MAKKLNPAATLPAEARLVVPVLAAIGGSGRSTTAGMLAGSLSAMASVLVLDTAPRLASPWPSWPSEPGAGLASVPPDVPMTRRQVLAAASRCAAPGGREWHVLTDHQEWSGAPLALPEDPAAWYQLAAATGRQAVVADTAHPVAHDIVAAQCEGRPALTAGWFALPFSVPVFCAAATGGGVHALQTAVQAATAAGLPLHRAVVALVATGDGRFPAPVRAAATMLQSRVSAVVEVPHDPHVRSHGMRDAHRLKPRTAEAGDRLARAVLAAAHATWGEPLPPAPVPAAAAVPPAPLTARPIPEGVAS
ncbi:hypothetical protein K6I34_004930 [Streptomyces sp. UNOC14_S4]|nr:hypothetical protein [Streptomyces sp. UNOC14_S4]